MSGYIKLNRKFFEHSFWNDERTLSLAEAWLDLIASARFEVAPEKVVVKMNIITINRGELRASQRYLAKRWKWSLGKVNRFILMLERERMVERRMEHSETIIMLCNYDSYNQLTSNTMNTNENTNENADGTLTEHRQIQTKEYKEGEELKEKGGKKPTTKKKQPETLNFPFDSIEFAETWDKLIGMPKWKKKLPLSLQMALDSLGKYDEEFAILQMKLAIQGNWQGVTFSDTEQKFEQWKKTKYGTAKKNSTKGQATDDAAASIFARIEETQS
ncbi:MAG: hypothetical protein CVU09_00300 [Bacteroidetes bacterium HGW-Bacteroidetes-4]|jgi:hypothetical protein|nr:MAG: hypothetical protein CVU09_00300 [Bacteroidetes bacterium HGW-Bacteroidetes-4]